MRSKLQQFGLIALGVCLGVMISLNFSAVAQRDVLGPLPVEELRAFTEVFGRIKSDYVESVEDKKLITEAITGMLAGLDPHSAYLDQDAFREMQVGTQGEFGGLGIEVGMEDGFVKVVSPIDDTPAARAGVKSGDLIVKLDETSVKGMTLNDAVKRMRGKPNTQITLTIVRKGDPKPIVVTLTRAVIKIQSVKSKLLEPGYAYFRVTQFQEHTGETLAAAIQNLYKQNQGSMRGIVLDLRNDPGGLLNGAVAVSAAFLPQNTLVVYTDGRTEDAKMRLTASPEHYLRGRVKDDYLAQAAGGNQKRADGRARQRRLGVGFRNRRRRAAGPQARGHHGHANVRQRFGANHPAAGQQHRDQAHHGALLHAQRPLDPGQGHRAGHYSRRRHRRPRPGVEAARSRSRQALEQ